MRLFLGLLFILFWNALGAQSSEKLLIFKMAPIDSEAALEIDIFKGYISGISIAYSDGSVDHKTHSYHLLNFLNDSSARIPIEVNPEKTITSISYSFGTDSLINTQGVYSGDLDPILGMYWAWNSGYINLKLEGSVHGTPFSYHIGGYLNPSPTVQPISHPISFPENDTFTITFDLAQLISTASVEENPRILSPGFKAYTFALDFVKIISFDE